MLPPTFVPLSKALSFWPSQLFSEPEFLDEIGVRDFQIAQSHERLMVSGTALWLREIGFDIVGIQGFSVVLLNENGHTAVPFEINLTQGFALTLPNLTFTIRLASQLLRPVRLENKKWVEILDAEGKLKPAEVRLDGIGVTVLHTGDFQFLMPQGAPQLSLGAVQIGDTGVVIEIDGVRPYFSRKQKPPTGAARGFRGLAITSVKLHLPNDLDVPLAPTDLTFSNMLIGTGGFSGKITGGWTPTLVDDAKEFSGNGAGNLFGIPFGLRSLSIEFKQNTPTDFELKGDLILPFFDHPVTVGIGVGLTGDFTVSLDSGAANGLYKLIKPGVLEIELDSIGFELKDGVFLAKLSGQLTPLFGADKGLKWPGFKVEELSINSKGDVFLEGGWLALREQYALDFYGFKIGITKLGFGKTDDGGKWVGFSGELKLVDGFTAGASVDGLRVTWYQGHPNKTKITLDGVGVEFEIPDVLRFKGHVAYQEIEVGGGSVHRFVGDIKLKLVALKMDIDAKLIIGSASGGPQGSYNFFAIYLAADLPAGIPIGAIPLKLYGMAGLFALQMEPNKKESEDWYEGWYKRPAMGVTDLEQKWINHRGSMALGCGVTLGTLDAGFTFACQALLVILIPGKIVLIDGRANLLKERAKLNDNPMFRALAVLDTSKNQISINLDAQYKRDEQGRVLDIRASADAFFHKPDDWHIYLGKREPRKNRIRAHMLNLFDGDAYFMIDPKQLATGAWVGYARQWKFGPVSLTLEAWLEGNVVVNWTPLHFHGDLWLHGNVEVKIFGFGVGLGVDARFAADVFDPFHVKASIEVSIRPPKPLRRKQIEITLEWGPIPNWPERLPVPLKAVAIEHSKVTTGWSLLNDSTPPMLLPRYDPDKEGLRGYYAPPAFSEPPISAMPIVPLDGQAQLTFRRPVNDDILVGVNPQPVQPQYERIGNPGTDEGPVRARYGLKEIELAKWDERQNLWRVVASKPALSGVRTLYGAWAPIPQLTSGTDQGAVANVNLRLWDRTPFGHTRHGEDDWNDWFTTNFPNYPCVPQDIPDREVCFDFETLDSSQWLQSPWQLPQHPEITLGWQSPPRQHVTTLDPPVDGFTHALSFPAVVSACLPPPPADLSPPVLANTTAQPGSGPTQPNTVTIKLSTPAKQVKLWVLEGKTDQVCLNFRNRELAKVDLPHVEQGMTFGPRGITAIEPIATTLGDMMGLICVIPTLMAFAPVTITLPCPARAIELMLTYPPSPGFAAQPPKIEAFDSAGTKVKEKAMLNPAGQPEIVRFEGSDLKSIRINSGSVRTYLHELCFLCPDSSSSVTATAFTAEGKQIGVFVNQGNVIEIRGKDLSSVQVNSNNEIRLLKICTLFGPDPKEVAHREEMQNHLKSEVSRWTEAGNVFEPFSAYRLKIVTTIDAYGEGALSGSRNLTQIEYGHFRTLGPPGLTKLSLPVGRDPVKDADKFESGLEDLTRYVRQTTPATIPAVGEKPVMAKPWYRAYDIGVEFNEDYVDLMYRISGRDLGLYIYDSNNRPARDVDGRLLVQSGDWGAVEELTLTEGEQRWLALSNSENRCLPVISTETIAHDKKLTSAVAGRVLEPDMIHEARLVPLLLREGFQKYAAGTSIQGPYGKLGRWEVQDEGDINTPSKWEVRETSTAPAAKYLTQTSSIKGGSNDASDPVKPGTMLVFGNDPGLDGGHSEQPFNWTDYRLSVYLSASGGGAMGLVFRYSDLNNYYRFSMDRNRKYRRLVSVVSGIHTTLKQDDFIYEPQVDYLITIEAIGDALRVYQDGALIFDVKDAAHPNGSVGSYCYDNPGARFNDVRVDDFRQTAPVVYRFQFTTSRFANFCHHLHSYQDETWRAAVEGVPSAYAAMAQAVKPTAPLTDDEVRAYETLASTVLGPAARQNPPEVQVSRVEIDGAPLAFLVQSPEPIDWPRTEIALSRTSFARTELALPGKAKLAAVNFAANRIDIDSVVLLLREPMNLSAYRIEGRLVSWPLSPSSGVVIDAQTISGGLVDQSWATYRSFDAEKKLPAGTIVRVQAGDALSIGQAGLAGVDAEGVDPAHRIFYSIELRLVAPDGKIVHSRHFLPDDDYVSEYPKVLRKADGTGFFMVKLDVALNVLPLSLNQYRLKLTYHRNNKARVSTSQTLSQAGNEADEVVTLDIPLQTQ